MANTDPQEKIRDALEVIQTIVNSKLGNVNTGDGPYIQIWNDQIDVVSKDGEIIVQGEIDDVVHELMS